MSDTTNTVPTQVDSLGVNDGTTSSLEYDMGFLEASVWHIASEKRAEDEYTDEQRDAVVLEVAMFTDYLTNLRMRTESPDEYLAEDMRNLPKRIVAFVATLGGPAPRVVAIPAWYGPSLTYDFAAIASALREYLWLSVCGVGDYVDESSPDLPPRLTTVRNVIIGDMSPLEVGEHYIWADRFIASGVFETICNKYERNYFVAGR